MNSGNTIDTYGILLSS